MTLYGSLPSPYVRRIRILLDGKDVEFVPMNIFEEKQREFLISKNPTLKIPMLEDDGKFIFDSNVIYRYLQEKFGCIDLTWQQENLLTVINAVNDSMVQLLTLKRSGFDVQDDTFCFNLHRERAAVAFEHLDDAAAQGQFADWDYPAICLYCLLDWVAFRELYDWSAFANLNRFFTSNQTREPVKATEPTD
ncbi:glutathione S-transferase [Veronia nyctiphanis]|uniref:Glutathione S-transferase n=1 Tax=Veronia nyctiphanis TaxID=1278244 RepID=A0A4Q0YLW8_9GAMM|nr:glutathione S-transferase [Veronia nyctiphanis]